MTRQIIGLKWARRHPEVWPFGIPKPRPRGIKAFGRRYEAAVAKSLPQAEQGVWWEFRDANGPGICQTDFILVDGLTIVILECKHTWTPDGMSQLMGLYLPVVSMAAERPAIGIQVCKHIVPWAGPAFTSLGEALATARAQGTPSTLHWRGIVPIKPPLTDYQYYQQRRTALDDR